MKKIHILFVMLLLSLQTVLAQSFEVSGLVTYSDDGSPVIGATIYIKGTQQAVLSDIDGNYRLSIPSNSSKVLVFSYTGLQTQEVAVSKAGTYNVQLKSSVLQGEEIIVTGYGNIGRSSYAGAAAVVSTDKLKDVPSVSIADRLQGNVAGVTITSTSGSPGGVPSVRIRGLGSINAGNEPLYVIDGVPIQTGDVSSRITKDITMNESGTSLLATLNPNDIESITVIKDAAAASLYGSRAANGVIIITTKKGRSGKTVFNVKANAGFSNMAIDWRPTHNGVDRREILELGLFNQAFYTAPTDKVPNINYENKELSAVYAASKINDYAKKPWDGYTDWRDILLRTGFSQNYEISASGGNDKTRFYTSMSYTDTEGLIEQQEFERITGRINVDHKTGIFTLNASTLVSSTNQRVSSEGTAFASPTMFLAFTGSPSYYPYNENGTVNITEGFNSLNDARHNPIQARLNRDTRDIIRSFSSINGTLDLFDGFAIKQVFSYDYIGAIYQDWIDPRTGDGETTNGALDVFNLKTSRVTSQSMATYNKIFAEKHSFSALASFETEQTNESEFRSTGQDYPNYKLPSIENASVTSARSRFFNNSLMSGVGKLDYTYDNRLYVGGSFRTDGSSKLAPQNRWGNFWSVSSYYRFTNDEWYQNSSVSKIITDAKIRGSYGENGTLPSGNYDWQGVYQYGERYKSFSGSIQSRIANPDLSWERNLSTNIGLDLNFINKISVSLEYYNRDTKDLILEEPISQTTGFSTTLRNIGSMRNTGIELDIRAQVIQKKDFSWVVGLNLGHNKNTLTSLSVGQTEIIDIDGIRIHRVGKAYNSFYTYEYAGVDPETGEESFYINKEGSGRKTTTDPSKADKVITGALDPIVQGGFNSNFTYKWFDLGFTFTYSVGGEAFNRSYGWQGSNGGAWLYKGQVPTYYDINQMWTKPGDIASQPKFQFGTNATLSSRWLMKTDHLRLKNLTLGFSAPKKWTNAIKLQKLRIYASGSNLFTIKDKDLIVDPEVPATGIVTFQTPPLRTVIFGIEIGF